MTNKLSAVYNAGTNENLFGVSAKVSAVLREALTVLHRYPDPDAASLRLAVAKKLHLKPTQVLIGSGSGELISLLVRAFCYPFQESAILSISPTFPLYQMEAETFGVKYKALPLNSSFQVDLEHLLEHIEPETKLCFIPNPNNPTGSYLSQSQLEQLLAKLPPYVTLVIDEAYAEYVSAPDFTSALPYLQQHPNLIVLRTFSKAYGLASLRVGYMLAQEHTLNKVQQIKQPFNVNQLAQTAAETALLDEDFLHYTLQETAIGKKHLQSVLDQVGVQYWPSEGNFIYVDAGVPAKPLYQELLFNGVLVRHSEDAFGLRITIGTKQHQEYLHQLLQAMLTPTTLYQEKPLAQILEIGHVLVLNDREANLATASEQLALQTNSTGTPAERIALAYARAFGACQQHKNVYAGNLYSGSFGELDMISAFNVLVNATPLVTFGHVFSNLTIAHVVTDAPEVHILDLGIGSGLQWLHLLDVLANRPGGAPKVRITGIDLPAATGNPEQRLIETGERLMQHANALGITASYEYVATRLEEFNLQSINFSPAETLVVNSALTLHHIPDQLVVQPDPRDSVIQQIHAIKPAVFTLTEPDSEHNKLDFLPRLRESLRHYYTVFDALDTLLPKNLPERQIIEQEFFGREIINVMSCEGQERVERHERNEAWQRRLTRLRFEPQQEQPIANELEASLDLHQHFSLVSNGAGYTLHWKNTPVVAATAWIAN